VFAEKGGIRKSGGDNHEYCQELKKVLFGSGHDEEVIS